MSASVFFCGDIINMYSQHQFIGENLKNVIRKCDFSVGNLEGVLNGEKHAPKPMMQDISTVSSLKDAGFNLMLLANNHITDYGYDKFVNTINIIDHAGLQHIGAGLTYEDTYMPLVVNVNDVKIGFVNLCEASVGQWDPFCSQFGYAWIGDQKLAQRMTVLRKAVDFIVVCVHAGLEHETLPLPYFRCFYRTLCDLGADCVIGAHPHIVQGVEQYAKSIIFYSLGNLFFPRKPDAGKEDVENEAFSCIITFNKDRPLEYSIVQHSVNNMVVDVEKCPKWNIESLSNQLQNPFYEETVKLLMKETYRHHIRPQLTNAMLGTESGDSLLKKFKFTLKYFFVDYKKTQQQRDKLLRRLIVNETYRSIIDSETKYSIDN